MDIEQLTSLLPFLIPIIIIQIGLMVWALVDVVKRERVRGGNKVVWILIIVLVNLFGPIIYFIWGREEGPGEGNDKEMR
jgi:hypothetical protein